MDGTWHVDMDDWMYLVDERVMLNRAVMSKFGVRLGEVTGVLADRETSVTPRRPGGPIARATPPALRPLNRPVRDWKGRRVWIVGASSGIGAALAHRLGDWARGWRERAPRDAAECAVASAPAPGLALPLDVVDAGAVAAAAARIDGSGGGIDLVIWLAGRYVPMRGQGFDLGQARGMLAANLSGVLHGLDAVIPILRRHGHGGIALVASVAGYRGLPKSLVYGPTKAALINLAEALYLDLAPDRLGVWLVSPGFVDTPMTAANDFRCRTGRPRAGRAGDHLRFRQGRVRDPFPRRHVGMQLRRRTAPTAVVRRFTASE